MSDRINAPERKSAGVRWIEEHYTTPEGKAAAERYMKFRERPKPTADELAAAFFPLLCAVAGGKP